MYLFLQKYLLGDEYIVVLHVWMRLSAAPSATMKTAENVDYQNSVCFLKELMVQQNNMQNGTSLQDKMVSVVNTTFW